jgi:hypothetical protein
VPSAEGASRLTYQPEKNSVFEEPPDGVGDLQRHVVASGRPRIGALAPTHRQQKFAAEPAWQAAESEPVPGNRKMDPDARAKEPSGLLCESQLTALIICNRQPDATELSRPRQPVAVHAIMSGTLAASTFRWRTAGYEERARQAIG